MNTLKIGITIQVQYAQIHVVRSLITTGDLPPKRGQTIRADLIEEFIYISQIDTWNTNSSMEPTWII